MKIIKKNVYYCNFCNKRGLSSYWMRQHEEHCTMNPNRHCNMCERDTKKVINEIEGEAGATLYRIEGRQISDLRRLIVEAGCMEEGKMPPQLNKDTTQWLVREIGCPLCTLSFLRLNHLWCDSSWDWKKDSIDYLNEKREHLEEENVY